MRVCLHSHYATYSLRHALLALILYSFLCLCTLLCGYTIFPLFTLMVSRLSYYYLHVCVRVGSALMDIYIQAFVLKPVFVSLSISPRSQIIDSVIIILILW